MRMENGIFEGWFDVESFDFCHWKNFENDFVVDRFFKETDD